MKKERIVFLDYLRVFAIIAVIILHVVANDWYGLKVREFNWNVLNVYDSIR